MTRSELLRHPATDAACRAVAAGFHLRVRDGRVQAARPSAHAELPEADRVVLRHHPEVVARVMAVIDDAETKRRVAGFRLEIRVATIAAGYPRLLVDPATPLAPGICFSCGDALDEAHYGRCLRCALGMRIAIAGAYPPAVVRALDDARVVA